MRLSEQYIDRPSISYKTKSLSSLIVFKNQNVKKNNKGNNDGNPHQTLSIDKDNLVVNIDSNDGSNSWKSVWDYNTVNGRVDSECYFCFFLNAVFWVCVFDAYVFAPQPLPVSEYHFIVTRRRVGNLAPYGKPIQALCRGIPTYLAYPAPQNLLSFSSFTLHFL
uniref:Uncharacterized protein n=1 Tax=Apteryx owenii TaxID=8824 RepID=A0A8B9QA27_APTOW